MLGHFFQIPGYEIVLAQEAEAKTLQSGDSDLYTTQWKKTGI